MCELFNFCTSFIHSYSMCCIYTCEHKEQRVVTDEEFIFSHPTFIIYVSLWSDNATETSTNEDVIKWIMTCAVMTEGAQRHKLTFSKLNDFQEADNRKWKRGCVRLCGERDPKNKWAFSYKAWNWGTKHITNVCVFKQLNKLNRFLFLDLFAVFPSLWIYLHPTSSVCWTRLSSHNVYRVRRRTRRPIRRTSTDIRVCAIINKSLQKTSN